MHISAHKAGLALGGVLGGWHVVWSFLVAIGMGQWLLDFVFRLHMIHPVYTVGPFDIAMAMPLVVVTAGIGYIFGYAFAWCWNRMHRR